ncbi:MAG: SEL1-like repeat protein, partial [Alphaproteobacteria bacterium]|nr:SEL1-like repeat protein [Alphaproteobacteria bacterium]
RLGQVEQDVERTRTKFEEDHGRLTNQIAEALGTSHRSLLERSEQHAVVVGDLRAYVKELTGRLSAVENWLARTSRLATSDNDRNVLSTLARESGVTDTDSGTGGEGFAASTRPSARSRKTPPGWSRRAHWLVVSLALLLAIGGVGAAIRFQLLRHAPATGSSVATLPTGASVDARVVAMAKAGSAKAELVAGLKLLNGDGTATDVPSAAYWLRKAALQNQPVAEYWLATLYERGRAVPKDLTQAMQWYAKAATAGNAKAMYRLGVAYAEGWAGTPDYVAAAKWFSAAAQYGIIDAQFNLGVLYERGSGVPMSLKNAFTWYAIAAAQGDAQSKARLDVLAAHMSSSDVQAAQAAASAFKVLTPPPADNDAPDPAVLARQL